MEDRNRFVSTFVNEGEGKKAGSLKFTTHFETSVETNKRTKLGCTENMLTRTLMTKCLQRLQIVNIYEFQNDRCNGVTIVTLLRPLFRTHVYKF